MCHDLVARFALRSWAGRQDAQDPGPCQWCGRTGQRVRGWNPTKPGWKHGSTRSEVLRASVPSSKKAPLGTSLVAQWLRLCAPKAGAWVQFLVKEPDPTRSN